MNPTLFNQNDSKQIKYSFILKSYLSEFEIKEWGNVLEILAELGIKFLECVKINYSNKINKVEQLEQFVSKVNLRFKQSTDDRLFSGSSFNLNYDFLIQCDSNNKSNLYTKSSEVIDEVKLKLKSIQVKKIDSKIKNSMNVIDFLSNTASTAKNQEIIKNFHKEKIINKKINKSFDYSFELKNYSDNEAQSNENDGLLNDLNGKKNEKNGMNQKQKSYKSFNKLYQSNQTVKKNKPMNKYYINFFNLLKNSNNTKRETNHHNDNSINNKNGSQLRKNSLDKIKNVNIETDFSVVSTKNKENLENNLDYINSLIDFDNEPENKSQDYPVIETLKSEVSERNNRYFKTKFENIKKNSAPKVNKITNIQIKNISNLNDQQIDFSSNRLASSSSSNNISTFVNKYYFSKPKKSLNSYLDKYKLKKEKLIENFSERSKKSSLNKSIKSDKSLSARNIF